MSLHFSSIALPTSRLQRLIETRLIAHLWIFVSPTPAMAAEVGRAFLLDWLGTPQKSRSHPDLLELRPSGKAGLHSVAAVRQMVEQLSLAPFGTVGRAVLVEVADRMAPFTANALLKAFEEPPPSTTIVLATASPHLLLPTIVSRSQVVRLPGQPCGGSIDLSALLELLASSAPPYGVLSRACGEIQKKLETEQGRLSKELGEEGAEDLPAAARQELALEAEGGLSIWAQETSKQVLETVYLALRKRHPAHPVALVQGLLQAMNGIDRGMDLSTMLMWYLTSR